MASAAIFRNTLPPWVYSGDTSCSQSAGSLPVPSGTVPLSSLHIRKPAVPADLLHGFDNTAFPSYSPYHNREASFFLPPYHYLQSCCCFHYCGFIVHTQRCRFSPPKASRFAICRSTFHRFCTVRTFCNVLLNPHFREINAAVFHILNIGDQTVCSCSIQCFYADSQYTGCFLPCNQFIHRLLRHPFGICPVFFSLPVPECNNQAESLQLHQSHASAPYLPAQDSESRISCRRCRAVLPIP